MTNSTENKNKSKLVKSKKYMLVRYGLMNILGLFEHNESKIPKISTQVVVKTDRGLELGCIVGNLNSYRAGQFKWRDDQISEYFGDSLVDVNLENIGKFVRFATEDDISEQRHLRKIAKEETECCKRHAREMGLSMKIIDAEHVFGGERLIFYFMSNGRVDFRELVKVIAQEYQTRIEMRQIGSRDEAKLLGDVESCGQQCCCQRFLKLLKPVNMRMAKMQKATLDPSKISGYCGRLKCCLRYEDQTYIDLKKRLPRKNTTVTTSKGQGKVIDSQILTQLVIVEYEDGERLAHHLEDVRFEGAPEVPKAEQQKESETVETIDDLEINVIDTEDNSSSIDTKDSIDKDEQNDNDDKIKDVNEIDENPDENNETGEIIESDNSDSDNETNTDKKSQQD